MKFQYDGKSGLSGVYRITNTTDGKVYIGSAKSFKKRGYQHINSLKKGVHQNKHLQGAFNRDGTESFLFEVLEVVPGDKLARTTVEQTYLDQYLDDWTLCYNFNKKTVASPRSCWSKTPEETKKKMSERMSGVNNPMYGKSGELSPMYGHKASDEERERRSISAKRRGNNRPSFKHTEETKQKLREAHTGKKLTAEHRRKLSESHKGPRVARRIHEDTARSWLLENAPHIQLLQWGGKSSSKSVFLNTETSNKVYYSFTTVKYNLGKGMCVGHQKSKYEKVMGTQNG